MMILSFLPAGALLVGGASSAEELGQAGGARPAQAVQVEGARLAAPQDRREGARILTYGDKGYLVVARQGSNDLVCLADDPSKAGFHVACYHRDLEPYMARGRELRAQGISEEDNRKKRWKEIDDGKLEMPKEPRALYVLSGASYDAGAGKVEDAYLRWVIFTPYATPASSGLSLTPKPGAPWLMFPGTAGAHIMINPPTPK